MTNEEIKNAAYVRLPDADLDTPSKIMFESIIETAVLKAENDKLRALLASIINVSDAEKAIPFAGYRNYEDEVYAAIEAAKKDLK